MTEIQWQIKKKINQSSVDFFRIPLKVAAHPIVLFEHTYNINIYTFYNYLYEKKASPYIQRHGTVHLHRTTHIYIFNSALLHSFYTASLKRQACDPFIFPSSIVCRDYNREEYGWRCKALVIIEPKCFRRYLIMHKQEKNKQIETKRRAEEARAREREREYNILQILKRPQGG